MYKSIRSSIKTVGSKIFIMKNKICDDPFYIYIYNTKWNRHSSMMISHRANICYTSNMYLAKLEYDIYAAEYKFVQRKSNLIKLPIDDHNERVIQ